MLFYVISAYKKLYIFNWSKDTITNVYKTMIFSYSRRNTCDLFISFKINVYNVFDALYTKTYLCLMQRTIYY